MISSQRATEAAIQWVLLSNTDKPKEKPTDGSDMLYRIRIIEMYEAARIGNTDKALQLGNLISKETAKDQELANVGTLIVARAFALCYGHLNKPSESSTKVTNEQLGASLQGVIEHLKPLLALEIFWPKPKSTCSHEKGKRFRGQSGSGRVHGVVSMKCIDNAASIDRCDDLRDRSSLPSVEYEREGTK